MDTAKIASALPSLLKQAGQIMLGATRIGDYVSSKTGTANFVTEYDCKVQRFLILNLQALFPDAVFMAEEQENDEAVVNADCCFVIDPIDGTTNFIYDYQHSCISVAALSRGTPVVGAIYDPYLDELYLAEKGKGATLNGSPMRVSQAPLSNALVAYGTSPYYRNELGEATIALLREIFMQCSDIRRCGSAALDLAYLASGRNDAFFELRLSPWDFSAGYLLITEAGGHVTQLDGSPICFSKPQPILAGNPTAFDDLLSIAKKHQPKEH